MTYKEHFEKHYEEWFKGMSAKRLVECEQNLSKFIDSDLFMESPLSDEVLIMYELVRNECVYRVAKIAESPL